MFYNVLFGLCLALIIIFFLYLYRKKEFIGIYTPTDEKEPNNAVVINLNNNGYTIINGYLDKNNNYNWSDGGSSYNLTDIPLFKTQLTNDLFIKINLISGTINLFNADESKQITYKKI